jgi:hypothetical protein
MRKIVGILIALMGCSHAYARDGFEKVRKFATAGRLAFQAVPSWVIGGLSLLPAFAVRHPVCIRPSCTS